MAEKDPGVGEIDFSDGELSEMGVELAGRAEAAPPPRRSRSMLRVPVDEVPRPRGGTLETMPAASVTEPSLPAIPAPEGDAADEVVEHAFRNGGVAEGVVPAELRLAATPAKDEMEAFTAKLIADRERVIEMEMEPDDDDPVIDPDTDPRALAEARAGAIPRPIDDGPTRAMSAGAPRAVNPALAALARAVAVPAAASDWLSPSQATQVSEPPAEHTHVDVELTADAADEESDAEMELDDGELEDVEPAPPTRQRSLTPLVPPPPMPENAPVARNGNGNGHGNGHGQGNGHGEETPMVAAPASQSGVIAVPPPSPPAALASGAHAIVAPASSPAASSPIPAPPIPAPPPASSTSSSSSPIPAPPIPAPPIPAASPTAAPPLPPPASSAPPPPPAAQAQQQPAAAVPPAAVLEKVAQTVEAPLRPRRKRRAKQWFEEIFDDDYLRTLPFLTPRQTEREAQFIAESLQIPTGGALLDLACGYGRHAMELAAKSYKVTGLDLSLPLLIRAADAARRVGVNVNFIHGDMREMTFENEFDGAYCMFTSFGYFDDDTNRKVAANLARAIKPGGKLLIDVVNRDYIVHDLPTRVWWQGDGCVVLEEVDFNYFSSRVQVQRSIIFEDGRQVEQEISIRAYSLHEIGKVLHHSGFRVTEVSGGLSLRGKFFGANSRQLIVVAEKKVTP